ISDHLPGVLQREHSAIIVPADEEIREDVGIAAAGNRLNRVTSNEPTATSEAMRLDHLLRRSSGSRQIKNNSRQLRICVQDFDNQCPISTTDIDNCLELAKFISFHGWAVSSWCFARHRPVKKRTDLGMLCKIFLEGHAKCSARLHQTRH